MGDRAMLGLLVNGGWVAATGAIWGLRDYVGARLGVIGYFT